MTVYSKNPVKSKNEYYTNVLIMFLVIIATSVALVLYWDERGVPMNQVSPNAPILVMVTNYQCVNGIKYEVKNNVELHIILQGPDKKAVKC